MWIARKDPAPIAPEPQRVMPQQPPDAAAPGVLFAIRQGRDLGGDLRQAIPTEWHVALDWPLTSQRHRQRPRDGSNARRATSAGTVFEPRAALDHEARDPAADGGPTHPLLLGQSARSQSSSAAEDQSGASRQALCGGSSAHPVLQLTMLGDVSSIRVVGPGTGNSFFPASWPTHYPATMYSRKRQQNARTPLWATAWRCARTPRLAHCRACPQLSAVQTSPGSRCCCRTCRRY
jgi:hypothetical protein